MRIGTLIQRGLAHHRRAHLAAGLGVMTATATLTGALLVGDSMRGSLRETAVARLAGVDYALHSPRFVRLALADELARRLALSAGAEPGSAHGGSTSSDPGMAPPAGQISICPAILLRGGVVHAASESRAGHVNVLGVDDRFWQLGEGSTGDRPLPQLTGRNVILNEPLAEELGASVGDEVLLRVGGVADVSPETLLGRRDETTMTLRAQVVAVVPAQGSGAFSLRPAQGAPRNAWVAMDTLQRTIKQPQRVNLILVDAAATSHGVEDATLSRLQQELAASLTLADLGLRLRTDPVRGYVALESDAMLLEPAVEEAAMQAAAPPLVATPILTYLANRITLHHEPALDGSPTDARAIPYSIVSAIESPSGASAALRFVGGAPLDVLYEGEILLNEWAATDLGATPGDTIDLTYYVTGPLGRLDTRTSRFTLRGIVALDDAAADPGFTPRYPGITDAESLGDWDPPFPIDLKQIREQDDAYWKRYRTTPKAFIALSEGRRLWTEQGSRFGRTTSVRFVGPSGTDATTLARQLEQDLEQRLKPEPLGLHFDAVRRRAESAAAGSTDFGMLFIGFSFFLIAAAVMLTALLFRLGVERRAAEVGTLVAVGFSPAGVMRLLVAEGMVVVLAGAAAGLIGAAGYAWMMLAGLRTWWSDAVSASFLRLHVEVATLGIGFSASVIVALGAIVWSVRGLTRRAPRALLAGDVGSATGSVRTARSRRAGIAGAAAACAGTAAVLLSLATQSIPTAVAFFLGGAAWLVACLAFVSRRLHAAQRGIISQAGLGGWLRLGVRNAPRHPGRSLLTSGLIASATFVIVAVGAFRIDAPDDADRRDGGDGGFSLLAESAVPLPYDLNTPAGRESLGIPSTAEAPLHATTVVPFRLRSGDETSCLSLYRPTTPRVLGASEAMIQRGGFRFAATLPATPEEAGNPWGLLHRTFPDGAVPVIGDEAAVKWQLHLDVGRDLLLPDERGRLVSLRFVALLAGSVLQSELIIAEPRFTELFPAVSGHAFFLIDAPPSAANAAQVLERELSRFAFDVTPTADRLAAYSAVQNTYLAAFQTLGGLGLVLGGIGLAVVLVRNVWERRRELALLRSLGFSRRALGWVVLSENGALVLAGVACGLLPAMLALVPQLVQRPQNVPWTSWAITVAGVLIMSLGAGAAALRPALRAPLLRALRSE